MKELILVLLGSLCANCHGRSQYKEKEEQLEENNAAYDNATTLEEKNLKFNFEQNVRGTGFFSAYKYALMPDATGTEGRLCFNGVEAKNKAHGSGKLDTDSMMYAENSYTNKTWINGAYDEDGEVIEDEEEATEHRSDDEERQPNGLQLHCGHGHQFIDIMISTPLLSIPC